MDIMGLSLTDWITAASAIIQAISTIALVIVTIFYAVQTKRTVKEISKQREDSLLPFVLANKFKIEGKNHDGNDCIDASLSNMGKGIALNILVKFCDRETKKIIATALHPISYLHPEHGGETHIHFRHKDFENLRYTELENRMSAHLDCVVEFSDIYGRKMHVRQTFSLEKGARVIEPVLGSMNFHFIE